MSERVKEADALVSPSRFYAEMMRERIGPGGPEIEVMPNGIDLDGCDVSGLDADPPVIGYLARMIPAKGLHLLVDAFIHLRQALGDGSTRLHVAGAVAEGDERGVGVARRRLREAGLAEAVSWFPNISREEKIEVLRSLTLFSVPAVYREAFGLYVVEAMACGVPLVQPRAASFPEIVEDSGAGVLVEPGDPVALATGWRDLIGKPERLREMGKRGRKAAEEVYSVEAMRSRFEALAERLLSGSKHAKSEGP
jgi:glycosyltransferase involved in cell wall biosynthesis